MRDVLNEWDRMTKAGSTVGRAVVTRAWGSAPRPEGACLLADARGTIAGSVSGGCIESAAAEAIATAIRAQAPALVSYGVSNEDAWAVGLACGGTIDVFVEPAVRPELIEAARGPGGVVFATVVEGSATAGATLIVGDDGTSQGPYGPTGDAASDQAATGALEEIRDTVVQTAGEVLAGGRSQTTTIEGPAATMDVFFELIPRLPTLVVFGGVHIAIPLVTMARQLGYRTVVADARAAFLSEQRFPDADQLVLGWPEDAFEKIGLDRGSFVVVLSHDPKLDDPALEIALRSPARYVGALGSRKTQRARRERLRQAGLSAEEVSRLHGPVGLDLGGRAPAETALAILAEMTAVRYGVAASTSAQEIQA